MYRLTQALTPELIVACIAQNTAETARYQKLYNYYIGKHEILNRTMADPSKPNYKVVNPFGTKITNLMTGYFMGSPVAYTSDNAELLQQIQAVYDANDEQALNAELAINASIYGRAFELAYSDEEGQIRLAVLPTAEVIPLYDSSIQGKMIYAIRYYSVNDILNDSSSITYVDVYSKDTITHYQMDGEALTLIGSEQHTFFDVPVVEYRNNRDCIGDFEPVISKIDEYDLLCSDTLNDYAAFVDTYLVLKGMDGTEDADLQNMRETRTMLVPTGADVSWLTKTVQDTHIENMLNRIRTDIYDLVDCPNMTDEAFGNTDSGIALRHKLIGLEDRIAIKERYFKQALQYRLKLICNFINMDGIVNNYDYKEIKMQFSRNLPKDYEGEANLLNRLLASGAVSKQTALSMMSFITDPKAELMLVDDEAGAFLQQPEGGAFLKPEGEPDAETQI